MKKYTKYKHSDNDWLGEIPDHWLITRLKFLGDAIGGLTYSPNDIVDDEDSGTLVLRSSNIQNDKLDLSDNVYVKMDISDKLTLKKGDILICSRNGSKHLIGKNICIDERMEGNSFGAFMMVFRSKHWRFLYQYFNSPIFTSQSALFLTSTINQLTSGTLNNFVIAQPPEEEQTHIARYLDYKTNEIDTLISNKQKLIELLKEERTATINHAVTKGINPKVKLKPSGIEWLGDIPEHWELKKLKYVAKINPVKSNIEFNKESDEEVVFLPMEKVSEQGQINQTLKKKISEVSSGFTYFERDDIIVAKITPCFENGKGALLDSLETDFGFGSTEFHTIRATNLILKEFIYFLTKSEKFMTIGEAFMTGSAGQKRVPTNFIKEFKIGLPSIDEQKIIIEFIQKEQNRIELIVTKTEQEIELLKEYKTALISEVVTGKVDVRNEVIG